MPLKPTQPLSRPSRPAIRVCARQTRLPVAPDPVATTVSQLFGHTHLPATPALSGNDRIMTIVVKGVTFGVAHRTVKLKINSYSTTVPDCDIYVSFAFFLLQLVLISLVIMVILPARFNIELFKLLQMDGALEFLTRCAVYNGRKIALTVKKLPANEEGFVEMH
ncbi:hypothetical protein ARMGADRAFT_1082093 [Armillaria gallica]|uniref:Uncharacterized protein n=1 Tax=Armillaria gallica TaxID=47427 RepID=A0A2H3DSN5_ARMGA|nr:hypothetical protein ARMGADRAFT_1082093 [Armillaria gallica]